MEVDLLIEGEERGICPIVWLDSLPIYYNLWVILLLGKNAPAVTNLPADWTHCRSQKLYHYADNAISQLLYLLKKRYPSILDNSLEVIVAGGLNNEGSVSETLSKLKNYEFKVVGQEVNKLVYSHVVFDTAIGIITVSRKALSSKAKSAKRFKF